jgi:hypothetical protein
VVQYEDVYRLCYIRGPEGLLIGLAHVEATGARNTRNGLARSALVAAGSESVCRGRGDNTNSVVEGDLRITKFVAIEHRFAALTRRAESYSRRAVLPRP